MFVFSRCSTFFKFTLQNVAFLSQGGPGRLTLRITVVPKVAVPWHVPQRQSGLTRRASGISLGALAHWAAPSSHRAGHLGRPARPPHLPGTGRSCFLPLNREDWERTVPVACLCGREGEVLDLCPARETTPLLSVPGEAVSQVSRGHPLGPWQPSPYSPAHREPMPAGCHSSRWSWSLPLPKG